MKTAFARNWLDKCSLWRDENLMIVALLRLSIKFEVTAEHQRYGLELIALETEAVSKIECLLVNQLFAASVSVGVWTFKLWREAGLQIENMRYHFTHTHDCVHVPVIGSIHQI